MHLLWTILIGFLAGALAKFVMPGKDPGGIIITTLLGIGGAIVSTYIGQFIGWYQEGETAGFVAATVGAIILLAVYRAFRKRSGA
jgi:uncharacterized membrane protein YeaQ/YmgE (transglycosylase-associated protein family)